MKSAKLNYFCVYKQTGWRLIFSGGIGGRHKPHGWLCDETLLSKGAIVEIAGHSNTCRLCFIEEETNEHILIDYYLTSIWNFGNKNSTKKVIHSSSIHFSILLFIIIFEIWVLKRQFIGGTMQSAWNRFGKSLETFHDIIATYEGVVTFSLNTYHLETGNSFYHSESRRLTFWWGKIFTKLLVMRLSNSRRWKVYWMRTYRIRALKSNSLNEN